MKTVLNLIESSSRRARAVRRRCAAAGGWVMAAAVAGAITAAAGVPDAGAIAGPRAAPDTVWVHRQAYLMGTMLEGRVAAGTREAGIDALEEVFSEVERLERVLSSWRDESEIGRLNAAGAGSAETVSEELWVMLREVAAWSDSTLGAFDPAVGALIDAWDLRGSGRRPSPDELSDALLATGLDGYRIDRELPRVTRTRPAGWLDTGGFGKGAALRAAGAVLRRRGVAAAYLDFGGQIVAFGAPAEGSGEWPIQVAHPSRRMEGVITLWIGSGSVATSAQSERYVEVDGARFGHVLDPRTGQPVPGGVSVTVVARDPLVADILATALLVMGPEEGGMWAAGLRDVGVLFVEEKDGALLESWNTGFEPFRIDQSIPGETEDR